MFQFITESTLDWNNHKNPNKNEVATHGIMKIASGIVFMPINPKKKKLAGKMIFDDFRAILRFGFKAVVRFSV